MLFGKRHLCEAGRSFPNIAKGFNTFGAEICPSKPIRFAKNYPFLKEQEFIFGH